MMMTTAVVWNRRRGCSPRARNQSNNTVTAGGDVVKSVLNYYSYNKSEWNARTKQIGSIAKTFFVCFVRGFAIARRTTNGNV